MTSWLNWTVSERFGRLQLLELIHSIGWGDEFAYFQPDFTSKPAYSETFPCR